MQLLLKCTLLLLSLAFLVSTEASVGVAPHSLTRTVDMGLMQFMARSRDMSQQHPQRSLACFDYYLPLLNAISEEYERSYSACLNKAANEKCAVDNSTKEERLELEQSAASACDLFSACNKLVNAVSYFQCYADAGSENTKTMYAISTNASTTLAEVLEQYRLIENNEYRCTNASERAYVQDTAATYEQLQNCLQGKSPVPTTTSSSSSPPPTTVVPITMATEGPEAAPASAESRKKKPEKQQQDKQNQQQEPQGEQQGQQQQQMGEQGQQQQRGQPQKRSKRCVLC